MPGIQVKDMPAYVKSSRIEVLANTAALQAVRHKELRITGAAFYEPGVLEIDGRPAIAVDQSCIVLVRELKGGKLRVAVSKPDAATKKPKPVTLTVGAKKTEIALPTGPQAGKSVLLHP